MPPDLIPIEWEKGAACGANCLYLLLNLEGHPARLSEIRSELPIEGQGASLAQLLDCAEKRGLQATVRQVSPRELMSCHFPLILRMGTESRDQDDGHYVVGLAMGSGGGVTFVDGTSARRIMLPALAFNKHFTGYALVPTERVGPRLARAALLAVCFAELVAVMYFVGQLFNSSRGRGRGLRAVLR
ncbi:MAG: hypothetical protein K2Y37_11140 [Pirellulales bacterium]|nr:hypothetical protein [Pirellulales bacterium]